MRGFRNIKGCFGRACIEALVKLCTARPCVCLCLSNALTGANHRKISKSFGLDLLANPDAARLSHLLSSVMPRLPNEGFQRSREWHSCYFLIRQHLRCLHHPPTFALCLFIFQQVYWGKIAESIFFTPVYVCKTILQTLLSPCHRQILGHVYILLQNEAAMSSEMAVFYIM